MARPAPPRAQCDDRRLAWDPWFGSVATFALNSVGMPSRTICLSFSRPFFDLRIPCGAHLQRLVSSACIRITVQTNYGGIRRGARQWLRRSNRPQSPSRGPSTSSAGAAPPVQNARPHCWCRDAHATPPCPSWCGSCLLGVLLLRRNPRVRLSFHLEAIPESRRAEGVSGGSAAPKKGLLPHLSYVGGGGTISPRWFMLVALAEAVSSISSQQCGRSSTPRLQQAFTLVR